MRQTIWHVYRHEGVRGFYAGVSASLTRQLLFSSTRHGLFGLFLSHMAIPLDPAAADQHQHHQQHTVPLARLVMAGMLSGAIGAVLGNPADLVLVRMQADAAMPPERRCGYRNVVHGLRCALHSGGVRLLWRACPVNAVRAAAITAAQLSTYHRCKRYLVLHCHLASDACSTHLVAAMASAVAAALASNPVDVVKTRLLNMRKLQQQAASLPASSGAPGGFQYSTRA
jgi:solute carrier family 25 (mitochondrial oxoglutarate transporter), member 11